jgi:hypothetical protein
VPPKSPFKTLFLTNYFAQFLRLTKFHCFFRTDFVALLTEKGRNLAFPNVKLTNFANVLEFFSQFPTSKIGKKKTLTLMMVSDLQCFRLMKTWTDILSYALTSVNLLTSGQWCVA